MQEEAPQTETQPEPQAQPQSSPQEGTLTIPGSSAETEPPKTMQENLSAILIGVGTVMMVFVIARMLRRQSANRRAHAAEPVRQRPKPSTVPSFGSTATQDRLERLMTDGEELTRRLAAILENKAAHIEILIEHADQRLEALEAATKADQPPTPLTRTNPPARAPIETPTADPIDPLHRKVYDLADKGLQPVDIARQIDRPTGQVELILAIRRA